MKKIILILSVFLLGCGSAGAGEVISSAPTRSPESENIAVGSSDDAETESRAVQQLTLKNYRNTERVNFGGTELDEYIRDRFGFEIIIESSSTGNAQQEFEKDYSSGGFADITVTALYAWAPDYIKKLEKSSREGLFAEISGLLSTNAPNLNVLINRPQVPSFIRNLVINPENDGEIYFLPHGYFDEPYLTGWGLFIRGDIADALGVQTPDRDYIRTPERFYDLLVRIRDGYFMDTQGMPVYPLGIIDVWPHTMAAIARPFDFGGAGKIDFLNGKLQFFIQTPFAWDNIVWIRRLIDNGLIDPDCFTDGYESGVEKLSNGRYAVTPFYRFMPTSFNGFTNAMTGQNPEMAWRSLGNMENWMKEQHMTLAAVNPFEDASSTAGVVMFNSNTNYLGDVMRMLDWMNTMTGRATVEIGWEDDDWYWNEDGLAQPKSSLVNNQWQESFRDQRYQMNVGNGHLSALARIAGTNNPATNPFGGDGTKDIYQVLLNDDSKGANIQEQLSFALGVWGEDYEVVYSPGLHNALASSYPNSGAIVEELSRQTSVMVDCFTVNSITEAERTLEDYVQRLDAVGIQEYLEWLTFKYYENPANYSLYWSECH